MTHTPRQLAPSTSESTADVSVRRDYGAVLAAVALVIVAALVGRRLNADGVDILLPTPPILAVYQPHVSPTTPLAVLIAVLGITVGPGLARRMSWRPLLVLAYLTSLVWTVSLALVDGLHQGWGDRLTGSDEYLHDLPRITSVGAFLRGFTANILDFQPGSWTTHVSSHPPLATLVFWALDRIGLGGGPWAASLVVAVGASAGVAVAVALRALGVGPAARRVLPALVLFPGAVWVGVSADGMFAGVVSWGLALAVTGVCRGGRRGAVVALTGGLLLGASLYLSYGLALMVFPVLAACWLSVRGRGRGVLLRWAWVVAGVAVVAATFFAAGFNWFDGVTQLDIRYYQGIATTRPYSYFVWANLAAFCLSAGPAVAAGLARAVPIAVPAVLGDLSARWRGPTARNWRLSTTTSRSLPAAAMSAAALVSVLAADLTGLSKAETERIWLSFAIWALAGLALVPKKSVRWLLIVQVVVALLVNHLTLTYW